MSEGEQELTADQLRARLVKQLINGGAIRSDLIARAFSEVPREVFLPPEIPLERVYTDDAIVVKWNEAKAATSSSTQPYLMADMLEALDLQPGLRVLEIGAGVGYNAAVMINVLGDGTLLTSVDLDPAMAETARQNLLKLGPPYERANIIAGDGSHGYPANAPYDRIIVTVQQWEISPDWIAQLKEGGLIILPLSISTHVWGGLIPCFRKEADGTLTAISASHGGFMPMRGQMAHPQARQDEVDASSPSYPVKLGLPVAEVFTEAPPNSEPDLYVSNTGLPAPALELLQQPEKLKFIPGDSMQFNVGELPPPYLKWNDMNPEQRRASRAYFGYSSLLAVAVEDAISTLLIAVHVKKDEADATEAVRYEARGLALAVPVPEQAAFDLALLVVGTAQSWRVFAQTGQSDEQTTQNMALAKLQEVWEVWQRLNRPLPSDYRPIAYPADHPAPASGYIIHRHYYNLLIPTTL